ncbi:MAG TPA: tRNA (guanosine(46)-N7)-methyltransferase TrmB [Phenylobacterium sp.]|jgi:tRNA (guanine-N7-)-methyltransferase|uniref:tRNA (guanosine(46)-N7)-methyltransferase TrmB n=1 Tax=Phenylobacterium sp. TaxID=1871053 RepID=UPI002C4F5E51|nr:tRNA (guanosine(46)-N7)-methyltransferase TrmB [Phenylobacterium sp.]HXA37407.1 tRNA (guanosine(46)-N7)-methyltransferase TrmB [Phenylobacterium sp.]
MAESHPPLRSYGRLKTRAIKPRQAALMETLLPSLRPPAEPFDPRALTPAGAEAWLEIGFGGGEHMAAQAARRPDVLILGAEPFQNGVASALRHIDEAGLANVRVHDGDARDLMARLPDACLARIFVLFPDPWPKTRHNKRRIVQAETVAEFARLLKPGGALRFASDWADYVDWSLLRLTADPAFRWTAERADDWRTPPADHITTRYEEKRLGDCAPVFLDFVRT